MFAGVARIVCETKGGVLVGEVCLPVEDTAATTAIAPATTNPINNLFIREGM